MVSLREEKIPLSTAMRAFIAFALLVILTASASARCSCEQSPALEVVPDSLPPPVHHDQSGVASAYRTLCVRVCDGYYFPISYATNRSHFNIDAAVCQSMYPPGEASLYVHRTTGEDARQAVSPETGEPLAEKSFAFAYRSIYDKSCAALFRPGSGPLISLSKPPVPESEANAAMVTPVALPTVVPIGESPVQVGPGPEQVTASAAADVHVKADGIRTVGPAYYYEPSYPASTSGEPPKLTMPEVPDALVVSTEAPPVAASIIPNPLDFFRKHKPAPPPEPDAESDPAN